MTGDRSQAGGRRRSASARGAEGRAKAPTRISRRLLGLYLSDHLSGATAGAERAERMASAYADTPASAALTKLAEEIRRERELLRSVIHDLGTRERRYRQAIAWVGERIGRLKGNGRVFTRSPLTLLLETELMRSAVIGKLGLWQTLETHAAGLGLDPGMFAELVRQARRQAEEFEEIHAYARERAFREDRTAGGQDRTGVVTAAGDRSEQPEGEKPEDKQPE